MSDKVGLITMFVLLVACRTAREPNLDRITGLPTPINNSEYVRINDSIVHLIELTKFQMPQDIKNSTVVIETYSYPDYLKILDSKYSTGHKDWFSRRNFKKHRKFTRVFWNSYKIDIAYADRKSINSLDANKYRFVVREAGRTVTIRDTVRRIGGWNTNRIYYMIDRKDNVILGEIKDLREFVTQLEK